MKNYIIKIEGYGYKNIEAKSLAHLIKDLQHLKNAGLNFIIIREDRRHATTEKNKAS